MTMTYSEQIRTKTIEKKERETIWFLSLPELNYLKRKNFALFTKLCGLHLEICWKI
jgi:hypothetical protein